MDLAELYSNRRPIPPPLQTYCIIIPISSFKENPNASKPSEHPPSGEKLSKDLGEKITGCRDVTSW